MPDPMTTEGAMEETLRKPVDLNEIARKTGAENEARPTSEYVAMAVESHAAMKTAASEAIKSLNATVERDGPMHPVAARLCGAHSIPSGRLGFALDWLARRTPPVTASEGGGERQTILSALRALQDAAGDQSYRGRDQALLAADGLLAALTTPAATSPANPPAPGVDHGAEGLREAVKAAYQQGCEDTHEAIRREPELALMQVENAEFGEAAADYAYAALAALQSPAREAASPPASGWRPLPKCPCRKCATANAKPEAAPFPGGVWWMVLCPNCGNKRCPHATDHSFACGGSNEPGQLGSDYQ